MFTHLKKSLLATLLICATTVTTATPIPVGLNLEGWLSANQIDTFGSVSGGGTAAVGGTNVPFNLSQGSSISVGFSEIGDGLDYNSLISGNGQDGVTYDGFGNTEIFSSGFNMVNTTATDYEITWALNYSLSADADGTDAFGETVLTFQDLLTSLFSESHTSDVFYGDLVNNVEPGTFGALQGASGSTSFVFNLAGNSSSSFSGGASLRGGVYDSLSSFSADFDFSLRIAGIRDLTTQPPNPDPVPEPWAISLIVLGLGLMFRKRNIA